MVLCIGYAQASAHLRGRRVFLLSAEREKRVSRHVRRIHTEIRILESSKERATSRRATSSSCNFYPRLSRIFKKKLNFSICEHFRSAACKIDFDTRFKCILLNDNFFPSFFPPLQIEPFQSSKSKFFGEIPVITLPITTQTIFGACRVWNWRDYVNKK